MTATRAYNAITLAGFALALLALGLIEGAGL